MVSRVGQIPNGKKLSCDAGQVTVISFLAEGGQGEVYKVELNGKQYALKYYFEEKLETMLRASSTFKEDVRKLVNTPHKPKGFLWPLYFVEYGGSFGYLMDLIPNGFQKISDYIGGYMTPQPAYDALIVAGINLCEAFERLHRANKTYKDISLGNIAFHPITGEVLIFDCDNITDLDGNSTVGGSPKFIAPELVVDKRRRLNRFCDLHSLAVLLFHLFHRTHPLEGKKEYYMDRSGGLSEEEVSLTLYGYDAQFIFADENDLNRYILSTVDVNSAAEKDKDVVKGDVQSYEIVRMYWEFLPAKVQQLFRKAFVDGIKSPHQRPQAKDWKNAFIDFYADYFSCPHCHEFKTYEVNLLPYLKQGRRPICTDCGEEMPGAIIRITIDESLSNREEQEVVLYDGALIVPAFFLARPRTNTGAPNYAALEKYNALFAQDELFTPILKTHVGEDGVWFENLSDKQVVFSGREVANGQTTRKIDVNTVEKMYIQGYTCRVWVW